MLRIHFTPEDLGKTRICAGPDPLWETLLSLYRLRRRDGDLVFARWRRSVVPRAPASTRLLTDLAPPSGYAPDFLTPVVPGVSLAEGLEALRRTTKRRLRTDLSVLADQRRLPGWATELAAGEPEMLARLAATIGQYFAVCLAPYWPRVRGRIGQERARQAGVMASDGSERLLAGLHPTARWRYPVLELGYPVDRELYLNGRGLRLLPSFFCWGLPTTFLDNVFEPTLVYPIQHEAGWSVADGTRAPLPSLLGRTRARILETIAEQAGTTSEIAGRADTSLPTVSQQAATLRAAGLVTSRQNGQSVLHSVTPLGLALLGGAPAAPVRDCAGRDGPPR